MLIKVFDKKNKRGQLSDAMTWIVATIIIIFILVIFVFASDILGGFNDVERGTKEILTGNLDEVKADLFNIKTNIAYEINSENKIQINNWIIKDEK